MGLFDRTPRAVKDAQRMARDAYQQGWRHLTESVRWGECNVMVNAIAAEGWTVRMFQIHEGRNEDGAPVEWVVYLFDRVERPSAAPVDA
jgi:hypothetical protein